jgi:hypothetical protein
MSVKETDLGKKGRLNQTSFAKGLLAYWGYCEVGLNGADIARYLRISRSALCRTIKLGEQVANERKLKFIS